MKKTDFYDGKTDVSGLGAGDSFYIADFLKKEHKELYRKIMTEEARFVQMFNIGRNHAEPIPRLVSAQSHRQDTETSAIYRMPGCNEKNFKCHDMTPSVQYICDKASKEIGQNFNHCVLALFQDQNASIGFHKDKVYDLQDNSYILSVSLNNTRALLIYAVDGGLRQTILLRPGSLLAIGPKTNKHCMHAIPKLTEEVGPRVSLSLRTTETYIQYLPHESADTHEDTNIEHGHEHRHEDNLVVDQTFKIVGKGAEFQTANYPFSTSHDDSSTYSEEVKQQIKKHTQLTSLPASN